MSDRCPFEIWVDITRLACTDDGRTGRALALVSRYMTTVSAPYQLQSLSASSATQLPALATMLERRAPALRRVRTLRIEPKRARVSLDDKTCKDADEDREIVSGAIKRILRAVKDTVEVLTLNMVHAGGFPRTLVPVVLPALHTLTLIGTRRCVPDPRPPSCPLPALQRLYVQACIHGPGYRAPDLLLPDLPALAPSLTHYALSGQAVFYAIVDVLQETICSPDPRYTALRFVLALEPPRAACLNYVYAKEMHETRVEEIKAMAKDVSEGRFEVVDDSEGCSS